MDGLINSEELQVKCSVSYLGLCLRLTNISVFQGIKYLVDNEILEWKPDRVAEFLYKEEGLNKTAIGDFLGER